MDALEAALKREGELFAQRGKSLTGVTQAVKEAARADINDALEAGNVDVISAALRSRNPGYFAGVALKVLSGKHYPPEVLTELTRVLKSGTPDEVAKVAAELVQSESNIAAREVGRTRLRDAAAVAAGKVGAGREEPGLDVEGIPSYEAAPSTEQGAELTASDEDIPSDVYRSAMLVAEGTAKNPNSTAVGPGQIIDPTFASYAKRLMPEREEWFKGKSNKAIADALRGTKIGDTTIENVILGEIEKDDRSMLRRLNKPATGGNLYLAHFLGNEDAAKVFSADPNTLVRELAPEIIRPNASITHNGRAFKDMTVGDLSGWATDYMNERLEQVRKAKAKSDG